MLNLEGNHNINFNNSISDFGARQVLGIGGSINSFIHTGNPYGNYQLPSDSYDSSKTPKEKIHSFADIVAYSMAFGVALFALIKSRKNISASLKNISSKLKNKIKKPDLTQVSNSIKNNFKNLSNSIKNFKFKKP